MIETKLHHIDPLAEPNSANIVLTFIMFLKSFAHYIKNRLLPADYT